ncbi:Ribonuclease H2 subunit A [Borealophlyctis nickersoniae]|nr:Ribonuclease H2 subunit A [Borealophlyctis nickersoniae]
MQTRSRSKTGPLSPDEQPPVPLPDTTPEVSSIPVGEADISPLSIPTIPLDHIPEGPCTTSWTHHADVPEECKNRVEVCLGVDEAGRGPVLGPMVYAVSYVPVSRKQDLGEVGFADSKQLKEHDRDTLFDALRTKADWIGWAVHCCSPQDISECMLRRVKYNLNQLAHETTIQLIRQTIARGVMVTEVFVDTVGPPDSYQKKLESVFPAIKFKVAKKADSLYPIVSAASICAKVTRDSILRNWTFVENGIDGIVSKDFGSGYPSDPNTVRWMSENMDPVFGYPRVMRFSWSTCANAVDEKGVKVTWPDDEEEEQVKYGADIRGFFKGADKPKEVERDVMFTGMGLKRVSTFLNT